MINLWKRFTDWLYYLRHPCTIITMDEAPAKGVQSNFTILPFKGGELPNACVELHTVEGVQKSLSELPSLWSEIEDGSTKTYKAGAFIAEGRACYLDKDGNVLPALSAKEKEHERELAWSQSMDWPIGDYFEFGKPDTSMMYRFLEEDE